MSDAVQGVSQYQSWSGAKDGNWHSPAKAHYIILPKKTEPGIRDLWLNDVTITPPVPQAPVTLIPATVPPGWKCTMDRQTLPTIIPPPATKAREIPVTFLLIRDGKPTGQLHRRLPAE